VRATPIVVLASGDGSLAEALIRRAQAGAPFSVAAVITDRSGINVLNRATSLGIQAEVVDFKSFADRGEWESALTSIVSRFEPQLVVSAGFMKILSPKFLTKFKMINSHPALLPSFPGAHAVADALAAGVTESGCTVFLVDDGVDTGPILAQRKVSVLAGDDEATLHERIKEVERVLLPEVVAELVLAEIREGMK